MNTYRELIVWQKAIQLTVGVYVLTEKFPRAELYGLTSQMRRAAASIPANIAEGRLRGHDKELKRFLLIASGSGAELETHIEVAKQVIPVDATMYLQTESLPNEVMRMLNKLISQIRG